MCQPTHLHPIVARAQAAGSTATTVPGATRFLLAKARAARKISAPGTTDFQPALGRVRAENPLRTERLARFASKVARQCAAQAHPFATAADLLASVTPDAKAAATTALRDRMGSALARTLTDTWSYRRAASRWAGGEHTVRVVIAEQAAARCESERVWSSNGRWPGTNSHAEVAITPGCIDLLGTELILSGLLTLDAEEVAPGVLRATWAEQSRGVELKLVTGWIVRGFHVRGGTLKSALRRAKTAERARDTGIDLRAERRAERVARLATAATAVRNVALEDLDLPRIGVRRSDSIRGGNCSAGTDAFIERFQDTLGSRTEVPAHVLLRLQNSDEVHAAVRAALVRLVAGGTDLASLRKVHA